MLQGHDPLITENNNKKKRQTQTVRKLFPPIFTAHAHEKKKRNAAFQAQLSTCKKKTKRRIIE